MIHIESDGSSTPNSQSSVEQASTKMEPALKAKWVDALRSGKYTQGHGYLLKDSKFCCLGVLLEIQGFNIKAEMPDLDQRMTVCLPKEYSGGMPTKFACDLGNRNDGSLNYSAHTFPEIALIIEDNL